MLSLTDLHIDGSETTVGDGAAHGTGEGEARIEGEAGQLLGAGSFDVLLDSVQLGAAGRGRRWCLAHGSGGGGGMRVESGNITAGGLLLMLRYSRATVVECEGMSRCV